MNEKTPDLILRGRVEGFLGSIALDMRNREDIRHAAARLADEFRLSSLEREHFGDPDKGTGIYAPRPVAWRTRWAGGEWSYQEAEPTRLDGREVQPLFSTSGVGATDADTVRHEPLMPRSDE